LPALVPAPLHARDLVPLEGVHGDGAHKGDVHAEAAVQARAHEADEGAELGGGPLRGRGGAVAAGRVAGEPLEGEKL
ncbi:MAG: hypothetical protein LQ346_008401, partial [Caloplaca aetnensis]